MTTESTSTAGARTHDYSTEVYYVLNYSRAAVSKKLDSALFADIQTQQKFFKMKLAQAHNSLRVAIKLNGEQACYTTDECGGFVVHRPHVWHGQCDGQVKITDVVTGKVSWVSNASFDRHFTKL